MIVGISKAFITAIFPARCQVCGVLFHPPATARKHAPSGIPDMVQPDITGLFQEEMAPFFCKTCLGQFIPMEKPCCAACDKPFAIVNDQNHAGKDGLPPATSCRPVRSAGLLEGALMDAIHALKYGGKIQLARPLGRILLAALIREFAIEGIDIIIPVPLHRARLRHRGFNQTVLMLREWPSVSAVRQAGIAIEPRLLARVVNTVSQTGLGRGERKANVRGAFSVTCPGRVKDKRVLVVDDVYTTGATSAECARVLIKAGAEIVGVLTLAHAD